MKKALSLILIAVMIVSLCACGNSPAASTGNTTGQPSSSTANTPASTSTGTSDKTETPAATETSDGTGRTIGVNCYLVGAYAHDILAQSNRIPIEICGDSVQLANSESSMEKVLSDLENFISSKVDGFCWFGLSDTNFSVGPAKAEAAGIPFAFYDKIPTTDELRNEVRNMKYFAGGVGNSDYLGGKNMAEYALSIGCKTAIISAGAVGSTSHDLRVDAFTEIFEAGGGKILNVVRLNDGPDLTAATDNAIQAFPEADCVFACGGSWGLYAVSALGNYGNTHTKVLTIDISPDLLPYLKEGTLEAGAGAHWVSGMFAACLLENYLDGHPILADDGKPVILTSLPLMVVPANMADLYQRFWIDEYPYDEEEIKSLLYRYNPDVSAKDFEHLMDVYSMEERLIAKYNAGKITAEELAAVGINVN